MLAIAILWYTSDIFHIRREYMANKKAASNAKKSNVKTSKATKPTTTKVTTVKAVESHPKPESRAVASRTTSFVSRLNRTPLLPTGVAEFVGTFLLVAIILTTQNQPIQIWFGLIGIVLVVSTLSGAHINPVATVGAWVTRRINAARAVTYLVAQVLGAMLALVVLNAFISQAPEVSQQATALGQSTPELFKAAAIPDGKELTLFFAELLGTIILGFAYASALRNAVDRVASAFTIASGYFIALLVGGSAASVVGATAILNPAAAIALQGLTFTSIWPVAIYVVASLVGGIIGFALYDIIRKGEQVGA